MSAKTAVLYVRTAPGSSDPAGAVEKALDEGRDYARENGFTLHSEIVDDFDDNDPEEREGWQKLMELVRLHIVTHVIVRWPNSISLTADVRYAATGKIKGHGVDVIYAWKPHTAMGRA